MNAIVAIKDGRATTTSAAVAAAFEKRHDNVLRSIDNLLAMEPDLRHLNFEVTFSEVAGPNKSKRRERVFIMDRDGFALLAMGFTGAKALKWKLKFIAAFNAMEAMLKNSVARPIDKPFLPALQEVEQVNAYVGLTAEVRRIYGRTAARKVYQMTALPQVEHRDPEYYPEPCLGPEDDGEGALLHLRQQAVGNGQTLGTVIRNAFADEITARSLEKMGIRVIADRKMQRFAVSEKHPVLSEIFAETPWADDWSLALAGLDHCAFRLTNIGGKQVRAVHIPLALLP